MRLNLSRYWQWVPIIGIGAIIFCDLDSDLGKNLKLVSAPIQAISFILLYFLLAILIP